MISPLAPERRLNHTHSRHRRSAAGTNPGKDEDVYLVTRSDRDGFRGTSTEIDAAASSLIVDADVALSDLAIGVFNRDDHAALPPLDAKGMHAEVLVPPEDGVEAKHPHRHPVGGG